jgi:cytochrome c556
MIARLMGLKTLSPEVTMSSRSSAPFMLCIVASAALFAALGCKGGQHEPPAVTVAESIDPRTAVALPAEAQQAVLREMRQMLGAVGGAMAAAAKGDTTALLAAIVPAGSAAAADPAIETLLPQAWKELAERTHGGFDSLAIAVSRTHGTQALKDTVLVRLARLNGSCTACHDTFRVVVR